MKDYNRKFGKLDADEKLIYAPTPLVIEGKNVWTNNPEIHFEQGYSLIETSDSPTVNGFYYTEYYEVENNVLCQKWEEHEEPDVPEEQIEEQTNE